MPRTVVSTAAEIRSANAFDRIVIVIALDARLHQFCYDLRENDVTVGPMPWCVRTSRVDATSASDGVYLEGEGRSFRRKGLGYNRS
jgi:hypothetical protein